MNRKKLLAVIGVVVALIAIVAVLVISKRRPLPTTPTPPVAGNETNLPITTEKPQQQGEIKTDEKSGATLQKISENPVFDFWVSPDSKDLYYISNDGKVFGGKNGPDLEISTSKLSALNRIEVSPSSSKILAAFGDPRAPQWAVFGTSDKFWSPLPGNITEATWGKNENQVFALASNSGVVSIVDMDLSRSPFTQKTVFKNLGLQDVRMVYSPLEKLLFFEKPSGLYEGRVFQFDPKTSLVNLVFAAQKGSYLSFSEDRNWLFKYSSLGGTAIFRNNLILFIPEEADADAAVSFATLPSKCNALAKTLFCFVPNQRPSNIVMPDDYLMGRFHSVDSLHKISLTTGSDTAVFGPGENILGSIDAKNLKVRGEKIYFINRYDSALYELDLKTGS